MYPLILLFLIVQLAIVSVAIAAIIKNYTHEERTRLATALLFGLLTAFFIVFIVQRIDSGIFSEYFNDIYFVILLVSISTMLVSIVLSYSYVVRPCIFMGFILLLVYSLFIYGAIGAFGYGIGIFGIGTLYGLLFKEGNVVSSKRADLQNNKTEINRDIFQVLIGGIIMLAIACGKMGISIFVVLAMAGYVLNNSLPNSRKLSVVYRQISRLERRGVTYGIGAVYLLAGASMLVGFISNLAFLEAAICILFIGDALATIVGISFPIAKLPYNRGKTIGGFLAFAIVSVISFYSIGIALLPSLAFSILLAFVESISVHFDDNLTISILLIILFYVLLASPWLLYKGVTL